MNILFLCVANSARSQLAEGVAKSIIGNKAEIQSAGSEPSGKVQEWAVRALKEKNLDISRYKSKGIQDLPAGFLANLDYVITLCQEEVCPVLPSTAKRLHWPIPDPAAASEEEKPDAFRRARDDIKNRIEEFWANLSNVKERK